MVFNKISSQYLRWIGNFATVRNSSPCLSILIYHSILDSKDPFRKGGIDKYTFEWHLQLLKQTFNVISLSQAIDCLKNDTLPPRAACITFDDGYRDNESIALPILKKYALTATFFIATKYLNGGCMWNDKIIESIKYTSNGSIDLDHFGVGKYDLSTTELKITAVNEILKSIKYISNNERANITEYIVETLDGRIPNNLMMNTKQVLSLKKAGMDIGAHTCSHPILKNISIQQAKQEIQEGKAYLEQIINEPITLFAYPNGQPNIDYTFEHVALLKELNFNAAVTTSWGTAINNSDFYQLPRFTPWDSKPFKFLLRLWRNCIFTEVKLATI